MQRTRMIGFLVAAAIGLVLLAPLPSAVAHGRRGGVYVGVGGFYGWGPYWGWGWGWGAPYWGWGPWPYSWGAPGGAALGYAMMSGMGAIDLSVKPKQAEVWVDGKYVAEARDLDGDPSYLWLKGGAHRVVVYHAGFRGFDEQVEINVGMIRELKVALEPGESEPPGPTAPDVRIEPPRPEGAEPPVESAEPGAEPEAPSAAPRREPGAPGGDVRLRVRPHDATVYVDGEYRGTARALHALRLTPGRHRVELVRPGFQPLERDFEVEAGRTTDLALSMDEFGGWKY
jgi:hypothetical protein